MSGLLILFSLILTIAILTDVQAQTKEAVGSPIATSDNASDYGFLPSAEAAVNVAALQKALDGGNKTLVISKPGVYLLDKTVYIDDDTKIIFGAGVLLKKTGSYTHVLINRGVLKRVWNKNISIDGLHINVNKVDRFVSEGDLTYGMRGHLSLLRVRNAEITRFRCLDLGRGQFCLQVCAFDNLLIDNFEIRGDKDGVHIGTGRNFVIRNGVCETFDDAIALNAQDYPSCQPIQGDIEDGLIENITDVRKAKTSGHFARLLTGAWVDWHKGIRLQHGDTVKHGKNVYRTVMKLGTNEFASVEAPVHTQGVWTDSSGLRFIHNQSDGCKQANIRNVTFQNLHLRDKRTGFAASWESGKYHRAVHPETKKEDRPECNVKLINVHGFEKVNLIAGNSNIRAWIDKAEVKGALFAMSGRDTDCSLVVTGTRIEKGNGKHPASDIRYAGSGTFNLLLESMMQERDIRLDISGSSSTRVNGTASISSLNNITPVTGDSIKVKNIQKVYNGTEWE